MGDFIFHYIVGSKNRKKNENNCQKIYLEYLNYKQIAV